MRVGPGRIAPSRSGRRRAGGGALLPLAGLGDVCAAGRLLPGNRGGPCECPGRGPAADPGRRRRRRRTDRNPLPRRNPASEPDRVDRRDRAQGIRLHRHRGPARGLRGRAGRDQVAGVSGKRGGRTRQMNPRLRPLLEAATRPYAGAGTFAWHFARGKLRHDPGFFFLLRRGLLPDRESLLDLGCGRGILLALLKAAEEQYQAGVWPRDWPAPPLNLGLRGIELSESRVRAARHALGGSARVDLCDLRNVDLPPCSVIVMIDVLFYLGRQEQEGLLDRAAPPLAPGGLLLVR